MGVGIVLFSARLVETGTLYMSLVETIKKKIERRFEIREETLSIQK